MGTDVYTLMPTGGVVLQPMPLVEREHTWFCKIGVAPASEVIQLEVSWDGGIWHRHAGKVQLLSTNTTYNTSEVKGGPVVLRGLMPAGLYLRAVIVAGTGFEVPIHLQAGTHSYVGTISTSGTTWVIEEELTLEEILRQR